MDDDRSLKIRKGGKHALILSVSLQAHIAGILRCAIELAKRGVTVTFVGLEQDIARLRTFDELRDLDFNLVSYQDFGPSEISVETSNIFTFLAAARNLFQPIFDKLVTDQKAGHPGPTCIIADRFLSWTGDVATKLKLPYYLFYSCGANYARVAQAYLQLYADGTLTVTENTEGPFNIRRLAEFEGHLKIRGLPALQFRELLNSFLGVDLILSMAQAMAEADGIIVNTFYELESPQIDAIQQSWEEDSREKIRKLFLIGPLSIAATFKERSFVADLDKAKTDCLQWLDSRPPQSVVYICLGSIVRFSVPQIHELAVALEASEQSFLWVLHGGTSGENFSKLEEVLPPNFEARTRGKGLVLDGWVPQLQILAHSSIAGFVTHCGWNSTLESITAGVPMIAWPQLPNDQFIVCRHLVDVLKVAVEVGGRSQDPKWNAEKAKRHNFTNPEDHVELEKAVRLLMSEEGNGMRKRVQELKVKAEAAVADGGCSKKALDDLVECIPTGNEL